MRKEEYEVSKDIEGSVIKTSDLKNNQKLIAGMSGFTEGLEAQPEPPWREPGQVKDAEYLSTAALRYSAEGSEIVGRNRSCFNNRPLYCEGKTNSCVLTGDRPFLRLVADGTGCWLTGAIVRNSEGKWFHEYAQVESRYRCGRMTWQMSDPTSPGLEIVCEVAPLKDTVAGFVLRVAVKGLKTGDSFVWACGGSGGNIQSWDPTLVGHRTGMNFRFRNPRQEKHNMGIDLNACQGNQVSVDGQLFRVAVSNESTQIVVGQADREAVLLAADASASDSPAALMNSAADKLPVVCGMLNLGSYDDEIYMLVQTAPRGALDKLRKAEPAKVFAEAVAHIADAERIHVRTPDPYLDAAVAAVCHSVDFLWDGQSFFHGCMSWRQHLMGWRVICGSTVLGWHDRVKKNALTYFATQINEDKDHVEASPDPDRQGAQQGKQSRFFGAGRIPLLSGDMYNFQTQFFDQTLREWRWTADPELERELLPALELHLKWARECFDPDDDGLYESYINTVPTDSVWYNGGGSVEESAYVYYGHMAAADMTRRAGDQEAALQHEARAKKIQTALRNMLWINESGHFGAYVEQGGHRRVHADAWMLSEYLPIDAGMTTSEEAIQALYYTEWALERIKLPYGGVFCQISNWVPSKWSTRDVFNGDGWHLALAYFRTGLADEGWQILRGFMLETAYAATVPGGFSGIGVGTDFGDGSNMFARMVAEGLFGYDPDYPNNVVRLRPAFPSDWPKASIHTPDFRLDYVQDDEIDKYQIMLSREAEMEMRLPVRAEKVRRVILNGREVDWRAEAGFGCTNICLRTHGAKSFDLAIELVRRIPHSDPVYMEGKANEDVTIICPCGEIVKWHDLHQILDDAVEEGTAIYGRLSRKPGYHLVLADIKVGELPQRQVFKVHVTDLQAEADMSERTPHEAPRDARWECLNLTNHYNGDICTIFQQEYISPRPNTCSVRLMENGYGAWTFSHWNEYPPVIDMANLPGLVGKDGNLITPQNVPFRLLANDKNIAFTSLWDNWPSSISIPVGRQADTVWMLICGSTFPMQTRIANAEVCFRYADGQVEKLPLVPPWNFWMLCPWGGEDYDYRVEAFSLPKEPPPMVQLGNNCRAMVLSWKLRPDVKLEEVTLETLSQDVVIGLMGLSLINLKK